jgi:hypothetical protein
MFAEPIFTFKSRAFICRAPVLTWTSPAKVPQMISLVRGSLPRGPSRFEKGEAAVIPNHCEDFTR